jgi:hypothetical protein
VRQPTRLKQRMDVEREGMVWERDWRMKGLKEEVI